MNKIYVTEIEKKEPAKPGPGYYQIEGTFNRPQTSGSRYSMRPRNDMFLKKLEKQRELPGPGNYFDSNDLAGKVQIETRMKN
jgi:hypothetical protein